MISIRLLFLAMKYFFLLFTIGVQSIAFGQITIKGKILNYTGDDEVYYHTTQEGMYTPYWEELTPKPNGTFTIKFENEGYGTTTVSFRSKNYRFFHDADSEIYFEIDQSKIQNANSREEYLNDSVKQIATKKIMGDYQYINEFYNQQIRTAYRSTRSVGGNYYSLMLYEASTPQAVNQLLDSLMQREFDQIDGLPVFLDLEDPSIDEVASEIKSFLRNEVRAFYGAIFLNGMMLKRKEQVTKLSKDSAVARDIYNREWEQMIEDFAYEAVNEIRPVTSSPDYIEMIESLWVTLDGYQEYHAPKSNGSIDKYVVDHILNADTTLFKNEKVAYAHALSGVQMYLMNQISYSPILLSAMYELQERHPNSELLKHYEPLVTKLEDYLRVSQGTFRDGKIIRKNYDSFDELIDRFEGKNILLDVWATWCGPCIQEFENKSELQPWLDSVQVELLYISVDRQSWADRWRNSIKYNELKGYHYRGDKEFIANMWDKIGGYKGAIPRYALIDKNGNIFLNTAARPSESDKLVAQINELILQIEE